MKTRVTISALFAALLFACPSTNSNNDGGGNPDGGDGGSQLEAFGKTDLDPRPSELTFLSMAQGPNDRVGVAYFASTDGGTAVGLDGGGGIVPNWEIRYVEWSAGNVSTPEVIATVQRVYGLSLTFQSSGEPAVAYLGGGSDDSAFWLQSDAAISTRSGGTWTEQVVARQGDEVLCGNPVSDIGFLVGLNPGLVCGAAGCTLAYRDAHNGQFPQQDWGGSDLEVAEGGPGSWTKVCVMQGGSNKQAYGGHIAMVLGEGGQPALVHDQVFGSADGTGQNVIFVRRQASGTWTSGSVVQTVANTQTGASLAWNPVEGYGIAVLERATNLLTYTASKDGVTWSLPDPVYQSGSGGWWPSLAFDPINNEPAIAYYVCSLRVGVNEGGCSPNDDALYVTQRIVGNWRDVLVDEAGGYRPKVGFLSSGKRFVVYRSLQDGSIKMAVER